MDHALKHNMQAVERLIKLWSDVDIVNIHVYVVFDDEQTVVDKRCLHGCVWTVIVRVAVAQCSACRFTEERCSEARYD